MNDIFRRIEKKYILDKQQYEQIREILENYVFQDTYGKSTICNIYFDTENYELISHSITKPFFKEKIRLRSYNTPNKESTVFLEIKRKAEEIVGKRRISMKFSDFINYMKNAKEVKNNNAQIKNELDYYFQLYNLSAKMYIAYDREAFYAKDDRDFRITFDSNIRARNYDLDLNKGTEGENILDKDKYVMEIKTLGSIPMWFVKVLEECKVIPGSFSKYGEAYARLVLCATKGTGTNVALQKEPSLM